MKKLLLAVPFLATLFGTAQPPKEKSLLWKIEGTGITQPSYLFGTIHIMCADDINLTPPLQSAFNSSKQLFLELDMDDPSMMMTMMQGMSMKDGKSLKDLLSEKDYDSVAAIFQGKTGMPLSLMHRTKPILLMSMLYPTLLGCAADGWDMKFMKLATEKEMAVHGLEKVEEQIAVLDAIPYNVQAEMLLKTLYNLDSTRLAFDNMLDIYKQQDLQAMYDMTVNDEDYKEYEAVMLKNRNESWIPVIESAVKEMPSFIAMGAAHLPGQIGVINLLRIKGYKLTPVKF